MSKYSNEGVTSEDFREFVYSEYCDIMKKEHIAIYESKDYKIPPFHEQLEFVLNHHKI